MATKSDFAQKLLNDLRQRKERMSLSKSSTRNTSRVNGAEGCGNPSQSYKGSRQTNILESVGSRTPTSQRRSSNGARSFEDSSKQLVPFGGSRDSQRTGDLSLALAFALENRGKPDKTGNNNPVLSFLRHISGRSARNQKMERGNTFNINQFQSISPIHINEISKGAQKLNQILKACSGGLNFDGYSVEIGNELLKGALDLQESLRVLADFQGSSEYTVTPQRKNRLVLLEEDEDGDDEGKTVNVDEQKQVGLPRFSFDKPSRNSDKQSLVLHKRSSSGLDFRELALFSEPKKCTSSSQSKVEKGRISNVIAKLMGLEEIPQKADSKSTTAKDPGSKQLKMMSSASNNNNLEAKKLMQAKKIPSDQTFDRAGMVNSVSGPRKAILNAEKAASVNLYSFKDTGNEKNLQEKGRREERTGKEIKQLVSKDNMQNHEGKIEVRERIAENRIPSVDRRNIYNDHGMQRQQVQVSIKSQAEKKLMEKKEKERVKQQFPVRKQKGSEAQQNSSSNDTILKRQQQYVNQVQATKQSPRELTDKRPFKGKLKEKKHEDRASGNLKVQAKNRLIVKSNPDAKGILPQASEGKPVPVPAAIRKVDHEKVNASQIPRRKDEATARNDEKNSVSTIPLKHKSSILQELKQKYIHPEETEGLRGAAIKDSEKQKDSSTSELEITTSPRKAEQPPPLHTSAEDECQNQFEMDGPILIEENLECGHDIPVEFHGVNTIGQNQSPGVGDVHELESHKILSSPLKGDDDVRPRISNLQQPDGKRNSNPGMEELLSDAETRLKQILMRSQIFISTAEALFKLNIPTMFFNGTDHNIQDEESKLTLDCAYEIMKRKGKRQESIIYPFHNVSVISDEVVSLDELVKHLNQDIEKLKYLGGNGSNEHETSDYLQTMLERDVQNREPDLNSMWDLSWNEKIFGIPEKEEIIRDLERVLLNGLIDEVLKDLFHLGVFV